MTNKLTKSQVVAQAKKSTSGIEIELYPSKCSPQNQTWVQGYPVTVFHRGGEAVYENEFGVLFPLDTLLNHFEALNCNSELGNRVHYYTVKDTGNES